MIRCFNYNKVGHTFNDCRQPKRERGSCYAYSEMGHMAPNYPKRVSRIEKEVHNIERATKEDKYKRNIMVQIRDNRIIHEISLSALLDSGSPISFIKIEAKV